MRSVMRMLPAIAAHRAPFVLTLLSATLVQLGTLALALALAWLAGQSLTLDPERLWFVALGVSLLASVTAALSWQESWASHNLAFRLLSDLRDRVFSRLRRSLPDRDRQPRSGDLAAVAFADVDALEWLYAHTLAQGLSSLVVLAATTTLSVLINPLLLLVWVPLLLFTTALPWIFGSLGVRQGAQLAEANAALQADVIDTVEGLAALASANALPRRRAVLTASTRSMWRLHSRISGRLGLERAAGELTLSLAAIGALLLLVLTPGRISLEFAPLAMVLSTAALGPFAQLSELLRNSGSLIAASQRILEIFDRPDSAPEGETSQETTPRPTADSPSALEFDRVTFVRGNRVVLREVSFRIAPGERVALVGPSGAGKSTCAQLALRMWDPDAGVVLLEGRALDSIADAELRGIVSAVPQDLRLLSGTIDSNIRLGDPSADAERVRAAANDAGVFAPSAGLELGLATPVGEHGHGLSGGQRARVAIARALLTRPRLLILDEATAGLDADADAAISEVLAVPSARAVLVIAHRPETIARCDRIIRMRAGRVERA